MGGYPQDDGRTVDETPAAGGAVRLLIDVASLAAGLAEGSFRGTLDPADACAAEDRG
jgi:hypothetical protein